MKKHFTTLTFLGILFFQSINVQGQSYIKQINYQDDGQVSLITFKEGTAVNTIDFKNTKSDNSINHVLKISEEIQLIPSKKEDGFKNFVTEYYVPFYNGYPIENSDIKVVSKNNQLVAISGNLPRINPINTQGKQISEQQAFDYAIKNIGAKKYQWESPNLHSKNEKPQGKLVYLPVEGADGIHTLVLAYKFDIYAIEPLSRDYVYVDAANGLVLYKAPIIKHANRKIEQSHENLKPKLEKNNKGFNHSILETGNAETRYSGTREIGTSLINNTYQLKDTSRGAIIETLNLNRREDLRNITPFTDNDNNWTTAEHRNQNNDDVALDAHWGVTKTYDYFFSNFNRNSYDNAGTTLKSYVHYGNNVDNAFWSGAEMLFGDGDTSFTPLTALDVTAHELGHAVCDATADLMYQRESGALNEGFSDIWGAIVEHHVAPEKSPFLIGEDIALSSRGFMRSMANPKLSGGPDTYKGINWVAANLDEGCYNPIYELNDYCGVHTNSSILNHWFYILVNGKNGTNDLGNAYDVTGIGWDNAAQIVYLIETAYLNQRSDYLHTRNSAIDAAIQLFGENSAERIAVQDAFYAVGIGGKYRTDPDVIAPSVPANLSASNTTGNATTLSWEPATDDNGIWGYIIYRNGVEIARTPNTTYRVIDLNRSTTYNFYVKAYDLYENESSTSNQVEVTTTDLAKPCTASGNVTRYFKIGNVKLNSIDNTSTGLSGYEDFATIKTEVQAEETYTIEITPTILDGYSIYPLTYGIFLDRNNTGTFGAAKRLALIPPTVGTNPVSASITIPSNATLDRDLRLRIVQMYNYDNNNITGCDNYLYGQIEDYGVVVRRTLATEDLETVGYKIYPNPVQDKLFVETKDRQEFSYEIVNTVGAVVLKGKASQSIEVSNLTSGVYILKMKTADQEITHKFVKK